MSKLKPLALIFYSICGLMVLLIVAGMTNSFSSDYSETLKTLIEESSVPNLTATIYLKNRLYDTIFEVFVFSIAVSGVWLYMKKLESTEEIVFISETPAVISGRIAAALSFIIGIHLALWGHLSPGGGFAAGVAGGTGLVLIAITGDLEKTWRRYEALKLEAVEKLVLMIIPVMFILMITGYDLPEGRFGYVLSGGSIPLLNLLIFFKVMVGTWLVSYVFIKHRGIL